MESHIRVSSEVQADETANTPSTSPTKVLHILHPRYTVLLKRALDKIKHSASFPRCLETGLCLDHSLQTYSQGRAPAKLAWKSLLSAPCRPRHTDPGSRAMHWSFSEPTENNDLQRSTTARNRLETDIGSCRMARF